MSCLATKKRPGRTAPASAARTGAVFGLTAMALSACASPGIPENALNLAASSLETRAMQSRSFPASSEEAILSASLAVLQDMEYNIDELEQRLGVLVASKVEDADSTAEKIRLALTDIACVLVAMDCSAYSGASDEQKIFLTLVVLPSLTRDEEYVARITIQRLVFDLAERIKTREIVQDPAVYQEIFERFALSLALQHGGAL